jgi:polyhydroxyalkanoate synthesis regulator phasin
MSTTTNYLINLYRSLIIKRDELKKQVEENQKDNYQIYADSYKEYYSLMVECIFLKKRIAYCQRCKNHHIKIYKEELEGYMDAVKEDYMHELEELRTHKKIVKQHLSDEDMKQAKKIFKRVIKRINPQHSLWERAVESYRYNNLNDLIDIEMLVDYEKQSIRKKLDMTYLTIQIERIKKEIESIENRNPKITKEYLEKKIMIYRLYKYNLDKQYSCYEKVMHAC